jgi:hypothetical protein
MVKTPDWVKYPNKIFSYMLHYISLSGKSKDDLTGGCDGLAAFGCDYFVLCFSVYSCKCIPP